MRQPKGFMILLTIEGKIKMKTFSVWFTAMAPASPKTVPTVTEGIEVCPADFGDFLALKVGQPASGRTWQVPCMVGRMPQIVDGLVIDAEIVPNGKGRPMMARSVGATSEVLVHLNTQAGNGKGQWGRIMDDAQGVSLVAHGRRVNRANVQSTEALLVLRNGAKFIIVPGGTEFVDRYEVSNSNGRVMVRKMKEGEVLAPKTEPKLFSTVARSSRATEQDLEACLA